MEFWPLEILDYLRRNENPEDIQYGYDEDSLKQLCAECEFENIPDDGSRDFPENFETIEILEEPEDPQQQKMQAATPEQRQAADASKKILDARHVDDEETSLKKSEQKMQAATPEQRRTADAIKKICDAMKKIRDARHVDDEEKKSEQKMQVATPEQRQAADAVKKICDASKKIRDARHVRKNSMFEMQAATPEQRQAADAVNNVLEEMIQLPALKKICDARHVDVEILTKVLENFKNSITQETLIQLAAKCDHEQQERKGKLTRYMPDSADAVNNVLEQMTQLPAPKKIRYAHDDDDDEETSLKKSEQVADNEMADDSCRK